MCCGASVHIFHKALEELFSLLRSWLGFGQTFTLAMIFTLLCTLQFLKVFLWSLENVMQCFS